MKCVFLLICILLVLGCLTIKAQDTTIVNQFNENKVGIAISKSNFDKKISNYLSKMSDWNKFDANEYIDMVRVYNTIGSEMPIKSDFYKMYYMVFLVMYSKPAAKELDAELSKGMTMYSKKHNIWIGDIPLGNTNSRYKVDYSM